MLNVIWLVLWTLLVSTQSVEDHVLHDARAVHDTALFRFQDFESNGSPSWLVATVFQGPQSGSATIVEAYIQAETGKIVAPKNAETVLIKEGRWKKLAAADEVSEAGVYKWTEPLKEKRILQAEDFYSPFTHGGTIIFRPTPGAAGIEQFGTVRLIFPDWHDYVGSALTFMRIEPVFQRHGHISRSESPRLTQLLSQDNKLITALAFRELVASGQITPGLVRNQLTHAEVNLGAIYTYLVLTSPSASRQQLVNEVAGVAKATHDQTKLHSIALGSFAASLFGTEDRGINSSSKSVLRVVRQRLKDLNIPVERDAYLTLIFEKMGV